MEQQRECFSVLVSLASFALSRGSKSTESAACVTQKSVRQHSARTQNPDLTAVIGVCPQCQLGSVSPVRRPLRETLLARRRGGVGSEKKEMRRGVLPAGLPVTSWHFPTQRQVARRRCRCRLSLFLVSFPRCSLLRLHVCFFGSGQGSDNAGWTRRLPPGLRRPATTAKLQLPPPPLPNPYRAHSSRADVYSAQCMNKEDVSDFSADRQSYPFYYSHFWLYLLACWHLLDSLMARSRSLAGWAVGRTRDH